MKKMIVTVITAITIITLSILGIVLGNNSLTDNQLETLKILLIICGASALYCFVVGELSHNNSQMDKLWSLLPIAYTWVIAIRGDFKPRLIAIAIIVTLWGMRLTFNFARKGAYKLKFWEGEEDYRWAILRKNKTFQNKFVWVMFNLLFISIYQNALVLAICLPALAVMESNVAFGAIDFIATFSSLFFLIIELIADEQQWKFYQIRNRYLKEGKELKELPSPYNKGFNTTGLWGYMRHPNYLGEQGIWLCLYLFVIGAQVTTYGIFNWTIVGPLFLVFLFQGSSMLGEKISGGKYEEYHYYLSYIPKYIPFRKYDLEKAQSK